MNLAAALAVPHSGRFQSPSAAPRASATEIRLARHGYTAAGSRFTLSLTETDVRGPLVLGTNRVGGVDASFASAGVAVRMAVDLSARGARSSQGVLESSRQPHGESRRNRGTN